MIVRHYRADPDDGHATIPTLVPLAAGLNEGSIIAAQLGTVVIGGLLSSTLATRRSPSRGADRPMPHGLSGPSMLAGGR